MVRKAIWAAMIAWAAVAVAACGGQDGQQSTTPDPEPAQPDTEPDDEGEDSGLDEGDTGSDEPVDSGPDLTEVIYFEFDSSALNDKAREQLQQNAEWLREDESRELTIEGHTDEVGTPEYNLALGERRAQAAKDYLVQLGIDSERVEIVTFGEERPGSEQDEENRRSVFVPLN